MNPVFAFCAIGIVGWVSPEFAQPISPSRENRPVQASYYQSVAPRPAWTTNEGAMRQSRMPAPPTDPGTLSRSDLPLPPTMNDAGVMPNAGMAGSRPRHDPAGPSENGTGRSPGQRPFDHYKPSPATSPYLLLNSTTNNGTISTYNAYVRPAKEHNQERDGAANNLEDGSDQPGPVYPRFFQNYGSYYPDYAAGR